MSNIGKLADSVCESGNHVAFNLLFDLLWEPMYGYATSMVQDNALAQDLVQEIWLDYWNRRESIKVENLKGYLFKAVRYSCYKHLRDTKFNQLQLEVADALVFQNDIEKEELEADLINQVNSILSTLPSRCQEIFHMSRINDFSNKEIAQILNISKRTVENQISTVLRKLRRELSIVRTFLS